MVVEVAGEKLLLCQHPAVFWHDQSLLLVADVHLGKVNHFRRSGIPVPLKANEMNLEKMIALLEQVQPKRFVFLGDLFHSHYNEAWEWFGEIVKSYPHVSFELVMGNHDIMSDLQYKRKNIQVFEKKIIGPFLFTHHPQKEDNTYYNLAGHIHPGVRLRGKGKQSVTLPCFYFGKRQGFLPAFGMFTGLARVHPKKDDQVFVIVDQEIIQV